MRFSPCKLTPDIDTRQDCFNEAGLGVNSERAPEVDQLKLLKIHVSLRRAGIAKGRFVILFGSTLKF